MGETEKIGLELRPGLVERNILDRAIDSETGIVDKHVDPSLGGDDVLKAILAGACIRNIEVMDNCSGKHQIRHAIRPTSSGVNSMTGVEKAKDRRMTDPAGSPGEKNDEWGV
jgi:hypothetical protein